MDEYFHSLAEVGVAVTGSSSGIGRALTEKLVRAGARVAAIDVAEKQLHQLFDELQSEGTIRGIVCDLRDDAQVASAMAEAAEWLSPIDSIVHCAGVGRYAPFLELTEADWRNMLEVNLLGAVRLAKHALPHMQARRRGQLIIVGSRRGAEPTVETSAYSASKAAVAAFARGLAFEVSSQGIHVCLLAPGGARTGFGGVDAEAKDARFLSAESVAESILHILRHRGNAWIRDLTLLPIGL